MIAVHLEAFFEVSNVYHCHPHFGVLKCSNYVCFRASKCLPLYVKSLYDFTNNLALLYCVCYNKLANRL